MHLKNVSVKNFRLLHDVSLLLEDPITVIVGRNNSGKTSLTEIMKRILTENHPTFRLEDFAFGAHKGFWDAFVAATAGAVESDIRALLPSIEVRLTFAYGLSEQLGLLADFIVDLDPSCTEALAILRYGLRDGSIDAIFDGLTTEGEHAKDEFFRALRERIPLLFEARLSAADPNDSTNERPLDSGALRALCTSGFISAQRGLDDASQKDRVVLGKVLENLFATAKSNAADVIDHSTAKELEVAVKEIEAKIGREFNLKLDALLPALSIFGYPGLSDPKLRTETTLDVARLLTNHTKVRYTGSNGVHLPEAYNGLGTRNIILMLLQLRDFFKLYGAMDASPSVHLVFIEEPEAHLHPQTQEVFIRKLGEIAATFSAEQGRPWPVQFIVSTHSSHVANETHFETIRYFLSSYSDAAGTRTTIIKDLRSGLAKTDESTRNFLHQYMTLTRCDLFFADAAILVEGTSERLLLPRMIKMIDAEIDTGKDSLGSRYLSTVEVGGAYAHIFFDLLTFLELKTLVITDIDTVKKTDDHEQRVACQVRHGQFTSNACIKQWFNDSDVRPTDLLAANENAKTIGYRRIAFQLPEEEGGPCGRSFEDAFMLANPSKYSFLNLSMEETERQAWKNAQSLKKSEFALELALNNEKWVCPRYIGEGLRWLAEHAVAAPVSTPVAVV